MLGAWMCQKAAAVVAISRAVADHASRYARRVRGEDHRRKIHVIYNGVPLGQPSDREERQAWRSQWGIRPDAFVVAAIGQIVPWKNLPVFLEAARRIADAIPSAYFVVAGDDMSGEHVRLVKRLKALVFELGLRERVRFIGYQPHIRPTLAGIDLLLHPAEREPFGRVIVEAMAAGKPVVAVGRAGPAEIIRDGVDGILTRQADPEELAQAVIRVANHPSFLRTLAAAGRVRAASAFPPERSAAQMLALYEELVQANPRAPF